jgi:tetratricopeptide (TPR) repeat protein
MTKILPGILAGTAILFIESAIAVGGPIPEYTAAEAAKHIGQNATVVGTIDCIGHGRRHVDLQIGGCDLSKAQLWIVLPNDATGPEVDPEALRGVTVAVTGKIESSSGTPQLTVKSTTQIQPRSALQTNYIGRAYDKEQRGDLDGASEDLNQAIEHQPARRNEACEHLARVKERRGDWAGALAAYDRLVGFDPNNASSYYVRATAKKQRGDFEGAMADFSKAAELRSSGWGYIEIANFRKARGDLAGAEANYDKAIALLDGQIARAPEALLYYHRGYAKELKGDVDGAVADYSQAIATKPSYGAGAYSRRGDIKKARGDLAGAIADYQYAVKYAQLNEDKEKLNKAKAEAKTRTKNVATQPNTQATQNEQSFNKSEVTPESIAAAFVQAYSGADVDVLAGLYADRIDHTNSGIISNAAVRAQAEKYFARWPVRHWSLVGTANTVSLGTSKKKVIFSAMYDASDPQTNKHASGIAKETLILATDASGAMKIVSQKEQISKGNRSQSNDQTSDVPGLEAAEAEASKKQPVANPSQTNAPAQAQAGKQTSPDCTSDSKSVWSEASPDKRLLATIRFVPNPDKNWRAWDDLKVTVFRRGQDGRPGQILASTDVGSLFLQCAHWTPDSQFLLFTTSPSRGGHGGWHFQMFVYCAGDHSFRGDLEDVFGNVLAPDFRFDSPDIAVLTVSDDQAPSTAGEEPPTKQVKVSLGKVVDKLDRLP